MPFVLSVVNNLPFRKAAHFQRKGAKGVNQGTKKTKSLLFMFHKIKKLYFATCPYSLRLCVTPFVLFVVNKSSLREPVPEVLINKASYNLQLPGLRLISTQMRMLNTIKRGCLNHGVVCHIEKSQSVTGF